MLLPSGWYMYWQMLCHLFLWLLVLPLWSTVVSKGVPLLLFFLADVIARRTDGVAMYDWQMLLPCGWCYCHCCIFCFVGRCCCLVADRMPTMSVDGRCCSHGGRWISHWVNVLILNLRFCVRPHAICEADGTCLCFCLDNNQVIVIFPGTTALVSELVSITLCIYW